MSLKERLRPYFQTRPRDPATGRPVRRAPRGAQPSQAAQPQLAQAPAGAAAAPAAAAGQQPARSAAAAGSAPASAASVPAGSPHSVSPELLRRRDELARKLAELQWDLGGLTYEMAIRDHFRLDVLVRRAAELQSVDADLGALEMLLRTEQAGAAGACPSCGALYSRGAVFCWQCGHGLMARAAVTGAPAQTQAAPPARSAGPGGPGQIAAPAQAPPAAAPPAPTPVTAAPQSARQPAPADAQGSQQAEAKTQPIEAVREARRR